MEKLLIFLCVLHAPLCADQADTLAQQLFAAIDAQSSAQKNKDFVRVATETRNALLAESGLIKSLSQKKKNGETLLQRAIRFEKEHATNGWLTVLLDIAGLVLPDQTLWANRQLHHDAILAQKLKGVPGTAASEFKINHQARIDTILAGLYGAQKLLELEGTFPETAVLKSASRMLIIELLSDAKNIMGKTGKDFFEEPRIIEEVMPLLEKAFLLDEPEIVRLLLEMGFPLDRLPYGLLSGGKVLAVIEKRVPPLNFNRPYGKGGKVLIHEIIRNYFQNKFTRKNHREFLEMVLKTRKPALSGESAFWLFSPLTSKDPKHETSLDDYSFYNPLVWPLRAQDAAIFDLLIAYEPTLLQDSAYRVFDKNLEKIVAEESLFAYARNPDWVRRLRALHAKGTAADAGARAIPVFIEDLAGALRVLERAA